MDIALVWDNTQMSGDLAIAGDDLQSDDGLTTAALLSFFLDAEASADDVLPDAGTGPLGGVAQGSGDRRGWWGDWYSPAMIEVMRAAGTLDTTPAPGTLEAPTDRIGSKVWLLARSKDTPDVLLSAQDYIQQSLQWLEDDGVASSVTAKTWEAPTGTLDFKAKIEQPTSPGVTFQYAYAWQAMQS